MKIVIAFCFGLFMLFSSTLWSQDIILTTKGDTISTDIHEIHDYHIIYGDSTKELNKLSTHRISTIKLSTGDSLFYRWGRPQKENKVNTNKNFFSLEPFYGLTKMGEINISYERLIKDGKFGIRMPIMFKHSYPEYSTKYFNKHFYETCYAGVDVRYYPYNHSSIRFYVSGIVGVGELNSQIRHELHNYTNPFKPSRIYWNDNYNIMKKFGAGTGVNWLFAKHFFVNSDIRVTQIDADKYPHTVNETHINLDINLGYSF